MKKTNLNKTKSTFCSPESQGLWLNDSKCKNQSGECSSIVCLGVQHCLDWYEFPSFLPDLGSVLKDNLGSIIRKFWWVLFFPNTACSCRNVLPQIFHYRRTALRSFLPGRRVSISAHPRAWAPDCATLRNRQLWQKVATRISVNVTKIQLKLSSKWRGFHKRKLHNAIRLIYWKHREKINHSFLSKLVER